MRRVGGLLLALCLGALGCATVPMASTADDARMKQWRAPPDSSLIYLYRNEIFGYAVSMEVDLDGRRYGATVAKSYMVWEVPPGRHMLVSHAENDASLVIDTLPGQRYFVWQEVKMGILYGRSQLHLVPEGAGAQSLGECNLVLMPLPAPRAAPPPPPPEAALAPPTS
jgi:Protein of unknown function (DUF2846)